LLFSFYGSGARHREAAGDAADFEARRDFFAGLVTCVAKNSPALGTWAKFHVTNCQGLAAIMVRGLGPNYSPKRANSWEAGELIAPERRKRERGY
jgi:hypothetical protein